MGTYKGNVGHPMQHWTLCELLRIAGRHTTGLNFIDAHAMSPWATVRNDKRTNEFDIVQSRLATLTNHESSTYERAWHTLTQENHGRGEGYPNSASFVKEVWEGDFSLLLCETDLATIKELEDWRARLGILERCKLYQGDWRKRFAAGLAIPSAGGLSDEALTLVSFDPNMYNSQRGVKIRGGARTNKGILYPEDVERALRELRNLGRGILVQISTYSTRSSGNQYTPSHSNQQEDVILSVDSIMAAKGFKKSAVVKANTKMMSLVYARNVSWAAELADLPDRFTKWLP